jgi:hypothetical protein
VDGNVKGFIKVTESSAVTERTKYSGKNLNHRIEIVEGLALSHCALGVESKRVVVAPETVVLTPPSPARIYIP